jgi:hypothetical protein
MGIFDHLQVTGGYSLLIFRTNSTRLHLNLPHYSILNHLYRAILNNIALWKMLYFLAELYGFGSLSAPHGQTILGKTTVEDSLPGFQRSFVLPGAYYFVDPNSVLNDIG